MNNQLVSEPNIPLLLELILSSFILPSWDDIINVYSSWLLLLISELLVSLSVNSSSSYLIFSYESKSVNKFSNNSSSVKTILLGFLSSWNISNPYTAEKRYMICRSSSFWTKNAPFEHKWPIFQNRWKWTGTIWVMSPTQTLSPVKVAWAGSQVLHLNHPKISLLW